MLSAAPTIGYLHTGIEKTTEQKKWQQVIPLVERMDYLSAQSNSMAFCLSVERLLGLETPERVTDIRVLIAELQRINSHLVWLGTHGMEVGAVSVMLYCFRERELLLNINEMLAGFRMFPSYMRVGGLREDLPRGFHDAVRAFLDRFLPEARRVRRSADEERDLPEAHAERRRHLEGRRRRVRPASGRSRAPPASTTMCASIFRTSATTPTSSTCRRRPSGDVYSRYLVRVAEMQREREDLPPGARAHHADRRRSRSTIRASRRRRRIASTPRWKR